MGDASTPERTVDRRATVPMLPTAPEQTPSLAALIEAAVGVIPTGITISDMQQLNQPLVYVNQGFEQLTGYSAQEVIGRNCRFLQGEERAQEALPLIRATLTQRESCTVILRNYRKDGAPFWNELSLYPLFNHHGELTHYVGVQHDISEIVERSKLLIQIERKSAQEAEQQVQSMMRLNDMSRALNLAVTETAVYQIVADYTPQIIHVDRVSVALLVKDGQEVEVMALQGEAGSVGQGVRRPLQGTTIEQAILSNRLAVQLDNYEEAIGGMRSRMSAPLITGGTTIGALNVGCTEAYAFTQRDEQLLVQIASVLASNIQSRRFFAQTQRALEETKEYAHCLALLNTMGQQMGGATSEAEIFQIVTQFALQIVPSERASIALLTEDQNDVEVFALQGDLGLFPLGVRIPVGQTLLGKVITTKQTSYTPDLRLYEEDGPLRLVQSGVLSVVSAPILINGEAIGLLNVGRKDPAAYRAQDISLVQQIATFLGKTIENTRLHDVERRQNAALLQALEQLRTTQTHLLAAEKMASLGRLVAGLAHEINTPIGIAVTAASVWEDRTDEIRQLYRSGQMKRADFEEFLQTLSESGKLLTNNLNRAADLIQSFKQVAVDQSSEAVRAINLSAYISEVVNSLRPALKQTRLQVTLQGDETVVLHSYPGALAQIITNLVLNSIIHAYAPEASGCLTITLRRQADKVCLQYTDDGVGIPPEHHHKIFEPFFTTRRGQGGSGLGLHIVYNLVTQKLGGTIRCQSQVGIGTTFIITLPLQV